MALAKGVFNFLVAITVVFVCVNGAFAQVADRPSIALATFNTRNIGVVVRGVEVDDLHNLSLWTEVTPADFATGLHAIIGRKVADALAIKIGDQFFLTDPQGTRTPFGVTPRTMTFKVAAVTEYAPFADATTTVYISRKALEELSGDAR